MILHSGMATSWTQADIDTLRAAIATGVLSVSYAGPPQRSITYQSTSAMLQALALMERAVNGTTSYRRAVTRKGL